MLTRLIVSEDQQLRVGTIFIPNGIHAGWEDTYSDAGSPDGELSGSVFWPENSLGAGA